MGNDCIEFPCGCSITETSVLAMCIEHDVEMRRKRNETRDRAEAFERLMLESIRDAIGAPTDSANEGQR